MNLLGFFLHRMQILTFVCGLSVTCLPNLAGLHARPLKGCPKAIVEVFLEHYDDKYQCVACFKNAVDLLTALRDSVPSQRSTSLDLFLGLFLKRYKQENFDIKKASLLEFLTKPGGNLMYHQGSRRPSDQWDAHYVVLYDGFILDLDLNVKEVLTASTYLRTMFGRSLFSHPVVAIEYPADTFLENYEALRDSAAWTEFKNQWKRDHPAVTLDKLEEQLANGVTRGRKKPLSSYPLTNDPNPPTKMAMDLSVGRMVGFEINGKTIYGEVYNLNHDDGYIIVLSEAYWPNSYRYEDIRNFTVLNYE